MPRPENLRVTFWGTHGSCPTFPAPWEVREFGGRVSTATVKAMSAHLVEQLKGGASLDALRALLEGSPDELARELTVDELPVFGGETTCVEIETSEGNTLILDWGSGIRQCASDIIRRRRDTDLKELYLFGSHAHLDHRLGFSFAGFLYADPPFDVRILGNSGVLKALDEHFGIFSRSVTESTYFDDPIDFSRMTASFHGVEIRSSEGGVAPPTGGHWDVRDIANPIKIGSTVVRPFQVYHGLTPCLGYKIEHGGKSFVFCTDHERLGPEGDGRSERPKETARESLRADEKVVEMCRGADLAYFDGQYSREEYHGKKPIGAFQAFPRVGWGHGCIEDILDRVSDIDIKHALIGHHDPERSWPEQVAMNEQLQAFSDGKDFRIELAQDGRSIEL